MNPHNTIPALFAAAPPGDITHNELKCKAFKEAMESLTHLPNTIGFGHTGATGNEVRTNAIMSRTFAAGFRSYAHDRNSILDRMSPEARSFAAGPPIDISALPTWAQIALIDRFEADFAELRINYVQGYLFAFGGGQVFSKDSVGHCIKEGTGHGLYKRRREDPPVL